MKIKVAFLDQDKNYLERIISVFHNRTNSDVEVYLFSDLNSALEALSINKINVFLANEAYQPDTSKIPQNCAFAFLVEAKGLTNLRGCHTVFKYQKIENFYAEILGLYSDVVEGEFKNTGGGARKITFTSAAGGCGSTSCAIAYALQLARRGKKVLFLNLEKFNYDYYFEGEGNFSFSDVLYNIKTKKSNLSLKLASFIRKDKSGVDYIPCCKTPLEVLELTVEDLGVLLNQIDNMDTYDYIVIDQDFSYSEINMNVWQNSSEIILVSDGSEIANSKLRSLYQTLGILEEKYKFRITDKVVLLYNRFSSKFGKMIEDLPIGSLGGIPRIEGDSRLIIEQLSKMPVLSLNKEK